MCQICIRIQFARWFYSSVRRQMHPVFVHRLQTRHYNYCKHLKCQQSTPPRQRKKNVTRNERYLANHLLQPDDANDSTVRALTLVCSSCYKQSKDEPPTHHGLWLKFILLKRITSRYATGILLDSLVACTEIERARVHTRNL